MTFGEKLRDRGKEVKEEERRKKKAEERRGS
jgi:hypothetical protein